MPEAVCLGGKPHWPMSRMRNPTNICPSIFRTYPCAGLNSSVNLRGESPLSSSPVISSRMMHSTWKRTLVFQKTILIILFNNRSPSICTCLKFKSKKEVALVFLSAISPSPPSPPGETRIEFCRLPSPTAAPLFSLQPGQGLGKPEPPHSCPSLFCEKLPPRNCVRWFKERNIILFPTRGHSPDIAIIRV